jgi:hypothetical protein
MKRSIIILALWATVICFQSGCTFNIPVDTNLPEEFSVEKLPITVGVHYSKEFQSLERTWQYGPGGDKFRFNLGPPSVNLFDQIFLNMFEKVVLVHSLPPSSETVQDINTVLVPELAGTVEDAGLNYAGGINRFQFEIKYSVTLYNLNGSSECSTVMSGIGESQLDSSNYWSTHPMMREATHLAMRNFAANFIAGFRKDKCLQSIILAPSN